MTKVQARRHLMKTVSYRVIGTLVTMLMAYVLTGEVVVAALFGGVEVCVKMLLYFLHERVWYKFIKYGVIQERNNNGNKNNSSRG